MREQEYRVPRAHGPKVAVIGGGHGLSNMLRGLKQYTENISAIVTVADDGGGSGMLRQDLGMPPPGDIRSCMEALANTEPVMRELLHYRFTEGSLAGQSFGNLFLAALNGISPSFDAAVRRMSQVLAITGRVLPVTTADVQLEAEFENGATVVGESKIFYCKKQEDCRIRQVRLIPSRPKALPEAVSAIADADMIVLGPGSLYTSIIPNLLVDGIVKAIPGVRRPEGLCLQRHDPGGGDGGLHRIRPHCRHLRPFGAGPVPPVPHQLLAHPQGGGRRYAEEGASASAATSPHARPWAWRSWSGRWPRWRAALSATAPRPWPGS